MTDTLVDTNVLIDVLEPDPVWGPWSDAQLETGRLRGNLVINQVIYAEISTGFSTQRQLDNALTTAIYRRENLPWEAAFGRAFAAYRRAGGNRRSPLPDFYIGAHAELYDYVLLTRDPGRYRQYFPALHIIAPDTHP